MSSSEAEQPRIGLLAANRGINLYAILQVTPGVSKSEIVAKYRQLALQYHPDRQDANLTEAEKASANERFKEISVAYEILSNETHRRDYDSIVKSPWFSWDREPDDEISSRSAAASSILVTLFQQWLQTTAQESEAKNVIQTFYEVANLGVKLRTLYQSQEAERARTRTHERYAETVRTSNTTFASRADEDVWVTLNQIATGCTIPYLGDCPITIRPGTIEFTRYVIPATSRRDSHIVTLRISPHPIYTRGGTSMSPDGSGPADLWTTVWATFEAIHTRAARGSLLKLVDGAKVIWSLNGSGGNIVTTIPNFGSYRPTVDGVPDDSIVYMVRIRNEGLPVAVSNPQRGGGGSTTRGDLLVVVRPSS